MPWVVAVNVDAPKRAKVSSTHNVDALSSLAPSFCWGCIVSQATPFAERGGSGHAATMELYPWQKLDVTNQIHALRRSHPLSWSIITSRRQHLIT